MAPPLLYCLVVVGLPLLYCLVMAGQWQNDCGSGPAAVVVEECSGFCNQHGLKITMSLNVKSTILCTRIKPECLC